MVRRGKTVGSIRAVSANFNFFTEIQLLGKIVRLRTKSVPILLKILNGLNKILIKMPSEVRGEGGNNLDIHPKKVR